MRLVLALLLSALLLFGATKTFTVNFSEPYKVQDKTLEPGQYKIVVEGDQAVLKKGKQDILTGLKVEEVQTRYRNTAIGSRVEQKDRVLTEIYLGGTNKKVVVTPTKTS